MIATALASLALAVSAPLDIARDHFGPTRCGPVKTIESRGDPVFVLIPDALAYADTETCTIHVNPDHEMQPFPEAMACTILVHEYGHLAGRLHSPNPWDVMYPSYLRDTVPGFPAERRDFPPCADT